MDTTTMDAPRRTLRLGGTVVVALWLAAHASGCRAETSPLGSSGRASSSTPSASAGAPGSGTAAGSASASTEPAGTRDAPESCREAPDILVFGSPERPEPGRPLRVVVTTDREMEGVLAVRSPGGTEGASTKERRGGPPYFWLATIAQPVAGRYAVHFRAPGVHRCAELTVGGESEQPKHKRIRWGTVWPATAAWDRSHENLYSAWIEALFDAPLEEQPTWPVLHDVLRDPARNFLYDHLGLGEDDPAQHAPRIDPDCADLPYFLRAYFAFKLGLPFGYSRCTRGGRERPPTCIGWSSSLTTAKVKAGEPLSRFARFLSVELANAVQSGGVRAPATDDKTDFYPVRLSVDALRPGTIYADPYGHILMLVRRVAQPPPSSSGVAASGGLLLAVDGQPDGTVARRRFWRGNFLFSDDQTLGSPGFKRFRPVLVDEGAPRPLGNDEIAKSADWGDFSLEQYQLGVEGFYDRMDDVLSPSPVDPARALREVIDALEEQVTRRVLSVQNGVDYGKDHHGAIDMPTGSSLFETEGPWEDYSTPSRDMRLLIAIDVVRGFPARVARRPGRYASAKGQPPAQLQQQLEQQLAEETSKRRFSYTRSNGTAFELSVADVVARASALEMAYNPNDCPELRWGAPAGSAELSSCARHAPREQQERMLKVRSWFAERRRPPRE
jgi:hypothetical protein